MMSKVQRLIHKARNCVVISAAFICIGANVLAADYQNCVPSRTNGNYTTQCPNGQIKRNDISVKCMKNVNKNTCLNTMPIEGVGRISEDVCYRGEGWSSKRNHDAMDYAAAKGTPVTAAADGQAFVNTCTRGGGRTVHIIHDKANQSNNKYSIIQSKDTYTSIYMHLASIKVSNGAYVKKGDVIGTVGGSTCMSDGVTVDDDAYLPHLHFELRDGGSGPGTGTVLDPMCSDIQSLCAKESSNSFYKSGWSSLTGSTGNTTYNAQACRDCDANPEACLEKPQTEEDKEAASVNQTPSTSTPVSNSGPCVTLLPENDLLMFTMRGESKYNPGQDNWYAKYSKVDGSGCFGNVPGTHDNGGCSYGLIQFTCGSTQLIEDEISYGNGPHAGGFRALMERIRDEKPELYAKLDMGGFEDTMKYACSDQMFPEQNEEFRNKWAALANDEEFYEIQYKEAADKYAAPMASLLKSNNVNASWNSLSPEVQMSLVKANIAGALPFVSTQLNAKYAGQSLNNIDTQSLIADINQFLANAYANRISDGSADTYKAVQKRAQDDIAIAQKSAQLREAIAQNPDKDPNEIAYELFKMRICDEDEMLKDYTPKEAVVSDSATQAAQTLAAKSGSRNCSVSKYRNSFTDCIFCDIFAIVFNTASTLAAKSYKVLVDGIINLVVIGMALWLAMLVLKYVSNFETKDPRNLAKEIFNKAFVVVVVIILLETGANEFLNLVLTPIFETGITLASMVLSGDCSADITGKIDNLAGGLPASMGYGIVCIVDAVQDRILDIMAVGSAALCNGFFVYSWQGIPLFPHFGFVLTGLILWIAALLLLIIYPWLLIDVVLNMCVAAVLLPVAIGAYAFQYTRKMFVSKVWGTFMEAMFMFVFLAMVVSVLLLSLDSVTAETFDKKLLEDTTDNSTLFDSLAWWSINLLKLVFVMLLGWAVLGEAKKFASGFASGISVANGMGSNVGTLAMSGVKGAGTAVGGKAKSAVMAAGGAVTETVKEKANDIKQSYQKHTMTRRMQNLSEKGTLDAEGQLSYRNAFGRKFTLGSDGQSYTYTNLLGQKVTKTLTKADNGKELLTVSTFNPVSGRTTVVSNDGYIRNTTVTDKKGNILRQNTEMVTAAGKYLINNDGTINQVAMNNIINNSAQSAEVVNTAILRQLIKERMVGVNVSDENISSIRTQSSVDEQGRTVFTLSQTYADGSINNLSMVMGANEQILTSLEKIEANGYTRKYTSDGIINKQSSYRYRNGEIDKFSVSNRYSFTNYYRKLYGNPMDSLGNIDKRINSADIMFAQEDLDEFKDQIANYGNPENLDVFK